MLWTFLILNTMDKKDIEALIKAYEAKSPENGYTQMCNSIIQFYHTKGYLTYKQVRVLERQVYENEKDEINQILNDIQTENEEDAIKVLGFEGEIKNPKGYIRLDFAEIPPNCNECPLTIEEYDEDAFWGSGYHSYCMFGCSMWESAIKRPPDCPIKLL